MNSSYYDVAVDRNNLCFLNLSIADFLGKQKVTAKDNFE